MTSSLPFIKAGRLRPLAVSSKDRSAQLPDVPTMAEAGVPNVQVRDWQGILGPRGMPKAVVDKLAPKSAAPSSTPTTRRASLRWAWRSSPAPRKNFARRSVPR